MRKYTVVIEKDRTRSGGDPICREEVWSCTDDVAVLARMVKRADGATLTLDEFGFDEYGRLRATGLRLWACPYCGIDHERNLRFETQAQDETPDAVYRALEGELKDAFGNREY